VIYEEVSIYRQLDSIHSQASRSGNVSCRPPPGIGHEQCQLLPMAVKIRRYGCLADASPQRARSRERAPQEDVCRRADQVRAAAGSPLGKVVRPSARREMAKRAVGKHGISIRLSREVYGISETCYRYNSRLSHENGQDADWLLRLTQAHKR